MADEKITKEKQQQLFEKYKKQLLQRSYVYDPAIPEDKIYFSIQGQTIGTTGNFVTITGLPKVGKSTIIGAAVGSYYGREDIMGIKLFMHPKKTKVVLFDTEQTGYDMNRCWKSIQKFAKKETLTNNLDVFSFREDYSIDIINMIETYLRIEPYCGIVIIDGLLDLLENMNDEGESKRLIRRFKLWGKKYDILIIALLHVGKKDFNSIGHIGSACDRYSQSTLLVEREKDDTVTLKPKFLRSAQGGTFAPINIIYNRESNSYSKNNLF